jgi:hypothetical protein
MSDQPPTSPPPVAHCPWCSAVLPAAAIACPSCGATLTSASGAEPDIRGVTSLDPEAILRARADVSRPRSRILSFITGDVGEETGGSVSPESLAPPSDDVRREMLRLQLEAERADAEAESVALKVDTVLEQGIDLATLADDGGAGGEGAGEEGASEEGAPSAEVTEAAAGEETERQPGS